MTAPGFFVKVKRGLYIQSLEIAYTGIDGSRFSNGINKSISYLKHPLTSLFKFC